MIRVDFSVPAEFVDVAIGMNFDEAWEQVNAKNARAAVAEQHGEDTLAVMAESLHRVSQVLETAGVIYAANCLHSFDGEPSLASLAVAVLDFPYGDDIAMAARGALHGILNARGAEWSGSLIDAPCGQAAVLTGGQGQRVPANLAPGGEEVVVPTAQFHAVIPIPAPVGESGHHICLIAFSTPNPDHWEGCYAPIMASLLRSLRFTDVPPGEGTLVSDGTSAIKA